MEHTQVIGLRGRARVRSVSTARPAVEGGASRWQPFRYDSGPPSHGRGSTCQQRNMPHLGGVGGFGSQAGRRPGRNKERSRLCMHDAAAAGVRRGPNPIQPARPCSSGDGAERAGAASTGGKIRWRSRGVVSATGPPASSRRLRDSARNLAVAGGRSAGSTKHAAWRSARPQLGSVTRPPPIRSSAGDAGACGWAGG